jgi:hypothetical protein
VTCILVHSYCPCIDSTRHTAVHLKLLVTILIHHWWKASPFTIWLSTFSQTPSRPKLSQRQKSMYRHHVLCIGCPTKDHPTTKLFLFFSNFPMPKFVLTPRELAKALLTCTNSSCAELGNVMCFMAHWET